MTHPSNDTYAALKRRLDAAFAAQDATLRELDAAKKQADAKITAEPRRKYQRVYRFRPGHRRPVTPEQRAERTQKVWDEILRRKDEHAARKHAKRNHRMEENAS